LSTPRPTTKWAPCKEPPDHGHEIVAVVIDSQWRDAAVRDFSKTTSFSLADPKCRPARLTLKTAPRFYYTLQIPVNRIAKLLCRCVRQ
jgi:hypothetical protein